LEKKNKAKLIFQSKELGILFAIQVVYVKIYS